MYIIYSPPPPPSTLPILSPLPFHSAEVQAIEDAGYAASQSFDKRSTAKASYTADGTFVSSDPDAGKAPLGNMMPVSDTLNDLSGRHI